MDKLLGRHGTLLGWVFFLTFVLMLPGIAISKGGSNVQEFVFKAVDYGFEGPEMIPSGWVRIKILNEGKDFHHIQILRLEDGKTPENFIEAMRENPMHFPSWAKFSGGPNGFIPGEGGAATVYLKPGGYIVTCLIPTPNGVLHAALGMVKPFLVTKNPTQVKFEKKKDDLEIQTSDYQFKLSKPVAKGPQTIQVQNRGKQPHEIVLFKLVRGKSVNDLIGSVGNPEEEMKTAKVLGGMTGLEKGERGSFDADLSPGNYALVCFFPDSKKAAPHFSLGMVSQFTVEE